MQALDLKSFVWLSKDTKENYIVMAITTFCGHDVVVFRHHRDRNQILLETVDVFCRNYEATYELVDLPSEA